MKTNTIPLVGILILALAFFFVWQAQEVKGTGYLGLQVVQKSATTTIVGPQTTKTIFAANPSCTARTISTSDGSGTAIRFLTADPVNGDLGSTTLALNGLVQLGSTTVTYEAGMNGCGKWTAEAPASTTITLVEYQ